MSERPVLSVVTALFDEEECVETLLARILAACRPLGMPFEVVVVDDGSADGTLDRLLAAGVRTPELVVVRLRRNFGHMPALSAGLRQARGEAVVVMDGDLQDPPELIPQFVEKWKAGFEVVYGLRTERGEKPLSRLLTAGFHRLFRKAASLQMPDDAGTFGLLDRKVVEILNALPERERFLAGLRAWSGGRQTGVSYARPERAAGKSRVGFAGRFGLAFTAFTSFSRLPLRFASGLSLALGVVLFSVGITAIAIRLFTDLAIPGWATFTTLLGITGFVQSLVLAILSEYVSVIFEEVKRRPAYLVREVFREGRPSLTDGGYGESGGGPAGDGSVAGSFGARGEKSPPMR